MVTKPIRAVYFDIGETLVDRSREYAAVARSVNVSPNTFSAVLGAMIAQGGGVDETFAHFGITREASRAIASVPITDEDLYPDARQTCSACTTRDSGSASSAISPPVSPTSCARSTCPSMRSRRPPSGASANRVPPSSIGSSRRPRVDAEQIVYVGDQLENDVVAPLRAGLQPIRLLRGPWGALARDVTIEAQCLAVVGNLGELADLLTGATGRLEPPTAQAAATAIGP